MLGILLYNECHKRRKLEHMNIDTSTSSRLIIVSNRLPYHITKNDKGEFSFQQSVGGLVTGLGSLLEQENTLWIGWADVSGKLTGYDRYRLSEALAERSCFPLYLNAVDKKRYYEGFSNTTLWPLFHGFSQSTHFEEIYWESYKSINERFRDAVLAIAQPNDIFWIQDYHLMLLPALLREAIPDATIGFFLHIPFPNYEGFRMLPWRKKIINGILGADVIGFHIYDYVHHFLSSCRSITGLGNNNGTIVVDDRLVQVDAFPLGIDYDRYRLAAQKPETRHGVKLLRNEKRRSTCKIILSVERLDYSKGVPNNLQTYDAFFERYPEWIGKVVLILVTAPSRENVASYNTLKKQIDALVGKINGKYSTMHWSPIDYYYRSLSFDKIVGFYAASDIMLVMPLRDGMNLVCKEYLACHDGGDGVLVLSEMAGASYELREALCVNPFDTEGVIQTIHQALTMSEDEQLRRNAPMQKRLARYTSKKWADEFLQAIKGAKEQQVEMNTHLLNPASTATLLEAYHSAQNRAVLLDYDGTLMPFFGDPTRVVPDERLCTALEALGNNERNSVAIISGRDKDTLADWLGTLPVDLVAEHGVWFWDKTEKSWILQEPLNNEWKETIRPALDDFVDRTPGAILEEKDYSLAWHYRTCNQELAERRVIEIKSGLGDALGYMSLEFMNGDKVVEIKPYGLNKGQAAYRWFRENHFDFFLVIGDDRTDEDMFEAAPDDAWTIRVGDEPTRAKFSLKSHREVRALLDALTEIPI